MTKNQKELTIDLLETLLEQIDEMNKQINELERKMAAMDQKTKTVATHCGYSLPELDIE